MQIINQNKRRGFKVLKTKQIKIIIIEYLNVKMEKYSSNILR